jgi:alanyl-tRNA synthetase
VKKIIFRVIFNWLKFHVTFIRPFFKKVILLHIVKKYQAMKSTEIRNSFLEFFKEKNHKIVASAPMVMKNDPTLMFTNAGMNQFKDIFLGNKEPISSRVADTQKCLRVTGKHNDLEEVGHDTYHHTMFEMLGNWSFGDYFKKEAIEWAWEYLYEVVKLDKDRIYVTVFEGDKNDNLTRDNEAANYWKQFLPENRILNGSKKDNFWEMGATGPCGPCSEVHIDLRKDADRKKTSGAELVNKDHHLVIEIWNLVFIQYNRKADLALEKLPQEHVDTGMGFERLCMAIQSKESNYDTDVFTPIIEKISGLAGIKYGVDEEKDIATRVIADHLRAISISIAEGQLPSNNKAGYVIRRILRRAIRYGYTYLGQDQPFIYQLVPTLVKGMGDTFQELKSQQELISKVIFEEEQSFLNTLENGIRRLGQMKENMKGLKSETLNGKQAFELYDTYGFPVDLTELILREDDLKVDNEGFKKEMEIQKQRSKNAAVVEKDDWTVLYDDEKEEFTGYDYSSNDVKITRFREVRTKDIIKYHLVFNVTPFYAESGGQVGDNGFIENEQEKIEIIDTQKENDLIIHISKKLPTKPDANFTAQVNESERKQTAGNHTATHLVHYALRTVLGTHVEQKGSLVTPNMFRFDFAHFQKVSDEEIRKVEKLVNSMIRQNIPITEHRSIPITEAEKMGAMSLFGEKYGDMVRVIKFEDSVELCGGIHAEASGQLGFFKVIKESSIAAGIRRIEAATGIEAEKNIYQQLDMLSQITQQIEKHSNALEAVKQMVSENKELSKELLEIRKETISSSLSMLTNNIKKIGDVNFISETLPMADADMLRDAAFKMKNEVDNLFLVLGSNMNKKALLVVMISENLVTEKGLNASTIIREISKEIQGGGGGQPFFATAGGKNPEGISAAIEKAKEIVRRA